MARPGARVKLRTSAPGIFEGAPINALTPTLARGERAYGFSLIEVLVALVILSVGLIAASRGAFLATADQGFLRDRTFARWVAHNELAALRLDPSQLAPGQSMRRDVLQGGVRFEVALRVESTPSPLFSRVEVQVRRAADGDVAPGNVLASAVGFASALRR